MVVGEEDVICWGVRYACHDGIVNMRGIEYLDLDRLCKIHIQYYIVIDCLYLLLAI